MDIPRLLAIAVAFAFLSIGTSSTRNSIDDQIIAALEAFRDHMASGWPDLGIPPLDPLHLQDVLINVTSGDTRLHGTLSDATINKLSTFTIDLVKTNMLFLNAEIALGLPLLDVRGNYDIDGQVGILPIFGNGKFWLDAMNVSLAIKLQLGRTDEGLFGVSDLQITVLCNTTDIYFENIMGGGDMADFVNGALSSLGPDILRELGEIYVPLLEEALIHEINQIIHGGEKTMKDDSVNDYFDLVFANMRQSILENGLDPMNLPQDSDNFTVTLFNTTMDGELHIYQGMLGGLATVHRAGDMSLLYVGEQDEAIWGGEVGLIDLQTDYSFKLVLALFGKKLDFSLKMSFVHLSFETDVFLHQSNITFAHCNITELGPMHFKEKGAGPLDTPVYNLLANTLLGELQGVVLTTVQEVICNLLEGAFTSG